VEKSGVLFSGELDHAQFRDHDRPTEDGSDCEQKKNKLAGNGGVFESEKQTTRRYDR
jgi:hypothetical protein